MAFLLLSLALFFGGGCAALVFGQSKTASRIGAGFSIAASVFGLVPVTRCLFSGLAGPVSPLTLTVAKLPMGEMALSLDLLSAVFLVPVFLLSGVSAVYGIDYGDNRPGDDMHTGAHWFFYNLLAGGMVLAVTAADAFLFLLAWEVMSLTPFFLITLSDGSSQARSAAWTYLVAAHLGALFLLGFFALLAVKNGDSLSFATFAAGAGGLAPGLKDAGLLFLLALIGFGAKAGIMPLHVWLPEAYPAVPSHVSAVMSGAMTKMGIYGLLRALTFLGTGEVWWAYCLIVAGAVTGFMGIIQAIAQPGIKRSLAFSSMENMGIICMALGISLLCLQTGHHTEAALAATGALLHLVNHSLSKGLLFLCAGCVLRGAKTSTLHFLGGLQKRMPIVGWCFVLASAAICALPPLNGFAGEFYIYLSMIFGGTAFAQGLDPEYSLVLWLCLFTLAGIGGFTLLCFTRLYGIAFLGAARSEHAATAKGPVKTEVIALVLLAFLCVASAVAAPRVSSVCHAALHPLLADKNTAPPQLTAAPDPASMTRPGRMAGRMARGNTYTAAYTSEGLRAPRLLPADAPNSAPALLARINGVFALFIVAVLAAFLFRRRLLRGREIGSSLTWDCGYVAPTARMQYTGGSYSRPAAWFMRSILRQKADRPTFTQYFPLEAKASLRTPDWVQTKGYIPLFAFIQRMADKCKHLQHGQANGYILYILITLVALLAWEFS